MPCWHPVWCTESRATWQIWWSVVYFGFRDENVRSLSLSMATVSTRRSQRLPPPLWLRALTNPGQPEPLQIPGSRSYKRSDSQGKLQMANAPVKTRTTSELTCTRSAVKTGCSAKDRREIAPRIQLKGFFEGGAAMCPVSEQLNRKISHVFNLPPAGMMSESFSKRRWWSNVSRRGEGGVEMCFATLKNRQKSSKS